MKTYPHVCSRRKCHGIFSRRARERPKIARILYRDKTSLVRLFVLPSLPQEAPRLDDVAGKVVPPLPGRRGVLRHCPRPAAALSVPQAPRPDDVQRLGVGGVLLLGHAAAAAVHVDKVLGLVLPLLLLPLLLGCAHCEIRDERVGRVYTRT